MNNITTINTREAADRLLSALGEQLQHAGHRYRLVVVGGSALLALGLLARATKDVDVVAFESDGQMIAPPKPLPDGLIQARDRVSRDFGLPEEWLNTGPSSLLELGLPEGFEGRLERREYGAALTVWFASRLDQIHLKLYAVVDQGPGRHEADLRALGPTGEELVTAARWARSHDPSEGFRSVLVQVLADLGVRRDEIGD
jgi:hypothetical protein